MNRPRQPGRYRICVQGKLDEQWSDWFQGMAISSEDEDGGHVVTSLLGDVPDQPALRGILSRIWDLGLTLISVNRIDIQAEIPAGRSKEDQHDDDNRCAER